MDPGPAGVHAHHLGLHHTHHVSHPHAQHGHSGAGAAPGLGHAHERHGADRAAVNVPVPCAATAGGPGLLHGHPPTPTLLQRLSRRAARTLCRVPNVPGLLVLALVSVAFWMGRFSLTTSLLPEPSGPVLAGVVKADGGRQRRTLQEKATEVRLVSAAASTANTGTGASSSSSSAVAPFIDPYNLTTFEAAVSRGLEKLKPALTPGDSGEKFYRTIPFQIISWYPRIVVYPNFVDKARREEIIELSKKFMYPSGLAYRPGEKVEAEQQVRTSKGTFLAGNSHPALQWLEDKIAAITLLPKINGEFWNVLNYKYTQHYDSHMDSFDPKEYGPQNSQRIATVIVVLAGDENLVGGETVFKREGEPNLNKPITNWTDCSADGGLKYKPRAGDAVLFWSARPDGELDQHALHGSCPVVSGEKWVAVKWLRNKLG